MTANLYYGILLTVPGNYSKRKAAVSESSDQYWGELCAPGSNLKKDPHNPKGNYS